MATNPGQDVLEQRDANAPAAQTASAEATGSATVPVKKTISCAQCRRRKLKCDRVKPCCGTCSRLQHQCVYPEGRMKSTTKRRNVKDLEARLGIFVSSLLGKSCVLRYSHSSSREPAELWRFIQNTSRLESNGTCGS